MIPLIDKCQSSALPKPKLPPEFDKINVHCNSGIAYKAIDFDETITSVTLSDEDSGRKVLRDTSKT